MTGFQSVKYWLVANLGIERDGLHICIGMTVFLLAALLARLPLRDWRPLACVIVVAVAGEVWDLLDTWNAGEPLRWRRSRHDVLTTMFWPALLFALARWTRLLRR